MIDDVAPLTTDERTALPDPSLLEAEFLRDDQRRASWGLQAREISAAPAGCETVEELAVVLLPVMQAVCEAVGRNCEVVLHDLSKRDLSHSVYAIYNGAVSNREVGSPSTSLGLEALRDESADHNSFGYSSRSVDGRAFRSSSIYYRNSQGRIIAALCVNFELTHLQEAARALDFLLRPGPNSDSTREVIATDIFRVLEDLVDAAVAATGRTPASMDKNDRVQVMGILEKQGAFNIKRAVEYVADRLGVSKVTAYGYLEEARRRTSF